MSDYPKKITIRIDCRKPVSISKMVFIQNKIINYLHPFGYKLINKNEDLIHEESVLILNHEE
ncbi:hypothetical protein ES702_04970 [subsurface metagenome]